MPAGLAGEARRRARSQAQAPGESPWPLQAWPAVPTRFVLGTKDRFFPPGFMRGVAESRLGIAPDEIAAGHAVALSRPAELSDLLAAAGL